MLHDIVFLLLGLALIIAGGNYVTNGAVAVATRLKVPPVIVGLTIVAFGSSTPDLAISMFSTVQGKTELAIGDIVGAGIFDMLLVVGITALIHPIHLYRNAVRLYMPTLVAAALIIFFCANDRLIVHHSSANVLDRVDGAVMLALFFAFMYKAVSDARHPAPQPAPEEAPQPKATKGRVTRWWLAALCIVGGLAALVVGGNWIVDGASGIARRAGLSEALIGLTIVAIGSSVPDLATSAVAAVKGQSGLAVGNVLGACIMDMLMVLGACAEVRPLDAGHVDVVDFSVLAASAVALWAIALINRKHTIGRVAGGVLAVAYVAYMSYLVLGSRM